MTPRFAYVLILMVVAFALLTAAAAEGLLDRLPPQPYFPRALAERQQIPCDAEGALWPDQLSDTPWDAPVLDAIYADWFGTHLRAAHEVSLSQPPRSEVPSPTLSIRLTWLRSFHAPIIVRVDEISDGEFRLTAKRLSGKGGYGPGGIADSRVRALTSIEAATVRRTLAATDLFAIMPVGCAGGVDGAEWLLEARDAKRYHLARRWSPVGGPVREVGDLLLSFTGWSLDPIY